MDMKKKNLEGINSLIGEGTLFKGEINSTGSLRVAGEVVGKIQVKGDVFVSENGKVVGNIFAERVIVAGEVEGNIKSQNGLEITKTGRVDGEVICDKLLIEEGSVYQGRVKVQHSQPESNENSQEELTLVEVQNA